MLFFTVFQQLQCQESTAETADIAAKLLFLCKSTSNIGKTHNKRKAF